MRPALARRRPNLAPLDPDAFLRWSWEQIPAAKRAGTTPHTLANLWFAVGAPDLSFAAYRRSWVRTAATVRRNQRLGLDPWDGIPEWKGNG